MLEPAFRLDSTSHTRDPNSATFAAAYRYARGPPFHRKGARRWGSKRPLKEQEKRNQLTAEYAKTVFGYLSKSSTLTIQVMIIARMGKERAAAICDARLPNSTKSGSTLIDAPSVRPV